MGFATLGCNQIGARTKWLTVRCRCKWAGGLRIYITKWKVDLMTARQRSLRNTLIAPRVRVLGVFDEESIGRRLRGIPEIRRPRTIWAAGIFTGFDAVVTSRLI